MKDGSRCLGGLSVAEGSGIEEVEEEEAEEDGAEEEEEEGEVARNAMFNQPSTWHRPALIGIP